jgi:hypothetical protein
MLPTLLAILTVAVLYWFPLRRWMGRWGTTSSDLTRVMAGKSGLYAFRKCRTDLNVSTL